MTICTEILYNILSYLNIVSSKDIIVVNSVLCTEIPKCLFSSDIKNHHPFWQYWLSQSGHEQKLQAFVLSVYKDIFACVSFKHIDTTGLPFEYWASKSIEKLEKMIKSDNFVTAAKEYNNNPELYDCVYDLEWQLYNCLYFISEFTKTITSMTKDEFPNGDCTCGTEFEGVLINNVIKLFKLVA